MGLRSHTLFTTRPANLGALGGQAGLEHGTPRCRGPPHGFAAGPHCFIPGLDVTWYLLSSRCLQGFDRAVLPDVEIIVAKPDEPVRALTGEVGNAVV